MKINRNSRLFLLLATLNILLFAASLFIGSVKIPWNVFLNYLYLELPQSSVYHNIILNSRLPQTLTATLIGISLSIAGLLMQTLFKNPLAGPGILGISSGASLGVAVFTLAGGLGLSTAIGFVYAEMNLLFAASLGSFFTLAVILLFSNYIKNNVSLLIVGIMIGYIASSLIGFLQFASQQQQLQSFVLWGLGSFSNVSNQQLPLLSFLTLIGVILSLLFIKPLNLLLLGDNYAANLGINIKRTRFYLILISGLLTAVSTVYAGPIAFIGLAVPHLSRMIFKTSEHKIVLPGLILVGIAIALACNIISKVPGFDQAIPINTVTSLFGAPLVVYFILKNSRVKINHS